MNPIKVFGHTTPDTDTVVSAIVYAWYLNEIQKTPAESYILGELNKETEYVLSTFNVDVPPVLEDVSDDDRVIIVDTNNPEELPGNLANATIVEIIDHHKLTGGITTQTPLSITMRPMAATASLIYTIFNPELHDMPKGIAGILCSAILSDTLAFRSPTTTNEDKVIAEELAEIAGINLQEHADKMFAAKSDISDMSAEDIIRMDSKVFDIRDGKKARLSVLETTLPQNALDRKDELLTTMKEVMGADRLDEIFMYIVDILNEESTLLVATDSSQKLAESAYSVSVADNQATLDGMISRKKQLLPPLLD